jgi:hypothetical protein
MEWFKSCDMKMVTFVTGSRRRDLLVFLLLACLIVATSYRLRVYYQVTVVKVNVFQITPDGISRVLPTPEEFHRIWIPYLTCEIYLAQDEVYIYDSFTKPNFRRQYVSLAIQTEMMRYSAPLATDE